MSKEFSKSSAQLRAFAQLKKYETGSKVILVISVVQWSAQHQTLVRSETEKPDMLKGKGGRRPQFFVKHK